MSGSPFRAAGALSDAARSRSWICSCVVLLNNGVAVGGVRIDGRKGSINSFFHGSLMRHSKTKVQVRITVQL